MNDNPKAASGALEHKERAMFCSPRRCCGYSSGSRAQSQRLHCPFMLWRHTNHSFLDAARCTRLGLCSRQR